MGGCIRNDSKKDLANFRLRAPEIIIDNVTGYIVNPFDFKKLSEKIIDFLINKDLEVLHEHIFLFAELVHFNAPKLKTTCSD